MALSPKRRARIFWEFRFHLCAAYVFLRQVVGSGAARERLPFVRWERALVSNIQLCQYIFFVMGGMVEMGGTRWLVRSGQLEH